MENFKLLRISSFNQFNSYLLISDPIRKNFINNIFTIWKYFIILSKLHISCYHVFWYCYYLFVVDIILITINRDCSGIDHYDDIPSHKVVDRHAYPPETKDRR